MGRQTEILEAINDRQREAERKQLRQKGELIATLLGTVECLYGNLGQVSGAQFHVLELGLDITYVVDLHLHWITEVDNFPILRLEVALGVNGRVVFSSGAQAITGYAPGIWEVAFNQLHSRAQQMQKERTKVAVVQEQKTQEDAYAKIREKWGL